MEADQALQVLQIVVQWISEMCFLIASLMADQRIW